MDAAIPFGSFMMSKMTWSFDTSLNQLAEWLFTLYYLRIRMPNSSTLEKVGDLSIQFRSYVALTGLETFMQLSVSEQEAGIVQTNLTHWYLRSEHHCTT